MARSPCASAPSRSPREHGHVGQHLPGVPAGGRLAGPLGQGQRPPGPPARPVEVAALPERDRGQPEQPRQQRVHGDPGGELPGGRIAAGRGQRLLDQAHQVGANPLVAELGADQAELQQVLQRAVGTQPGVRPLEVGVVRVEPADGGRLVRAGPGGGGVGGQPDRPGGVPGAQRGRPRVGGQPGPTERAQRLQHPVGDRVGALAQHQRAVHQVGQRLRAAAHRGHRGRLDRPGEHAEPDEQRAGAVVEQAVGPLDDVAQRPVPRRGRAPAPAERVQRVVQRAEQPGQAERRHPGGGQLQGQRQPVEPGADLLQHGSGRRRRRRPGRAPGSGRSAARPRNRRPAGRPATPARRPPAAPPGWWPAGPPGARPARSPRPAAATASSTCSQSSSTSSWLRTASTSTTRAARLPGPASDSRSAAASGGRHRVRVGRGQLDDQRAVGVAVGDGRGRVPGQPGLADATRPAQGQHPVPGQRRADPLQLRLPPDERADRDGRPGRARRRASSWRSTCSCSRRSSGTGRRRAGRPARRAAGRRPAAPRPGGRRRPAHGSAPRPRARAAGRRRPARPPRPRPRRAGPARAAPRPGPPARRRAARSAGRPRGRPPGARSRRTGGRATAAAPRRARRAAARVRGRGGRVEVRAEAERVERRRRATSSR